MTVFVTQEKVILYAQPSGPNTAMKPLSIDKHGMAEKTMPGTGRAVVWGRDAFSRFLPKVTPLQPPSGLSTSTVEEDDLGTFTFLSKMYDRVGCFPLQERWYRCGRLDGPSWTRVLHYGKMTVTSKKNGAGPSREANANVMFKTFDVTWPYTVELYQHQLEALTIGEDQAINGIVALNDLIVGCNNCLPGYAPDKILYLVPDANSGSPGDYANVWYSTDGGATWAITSSNPFAAAANIKFIAVGFISDTQFRVIVVDDLTTAQLKYADVTLGAEGTTTWSSAVTIGAAAAEALAWLFYDRLYIAVAGDIYVSTDQGATFGSATYTGTPAINAIVKSPVDDSVWAFGATNTILVEYGQSGTFNVKVGPTGGGAFTAAFIANDGTIYAGNGTAIYKSVNSGLNAGGWTSLKDFGANHLVKSVNCAGGTKSQGGDSQLIRVVVTDTVGNDGDVWESVDGGATWTEVTDQTNTGYNCAYFSPLDDNLAFIGGAAGNLQKMEAKAA